ncbi:MAG: O-antigen ligase family protein, partial [Actinomycetota bacterium]|nr:O-antigen ligase family protein [Actinomycetota bacterium]
MRERKLSIAEIAGLVMLALTSLGSAVALVTVNGQSMTPGRVLAVAVGAVVLVGVVRSRGGTAVTRWVLGMVTATALAIVAGFITTPDLSYGAPWSILAMLGLIAFTIQFWYSSRNTAYATAGFDILLVLWFALLVATIVEYVFQIHLSNSLLMIDEQYSTRIATLTWMNPNNAVFILSVLVTPALMSATRRSSPVRIAVWLGIGWLIFLSIFVNDAKLGAIVLLTTIILWVARRRSDWRVALVTTAIAIAAVVPTTLISQQTTLVDLAPYSPVSQWTEVFKATQHITDAPPSEPSSVPMDTSTGNRFRLWTKAVEITITHPLTGLGAGGYQHLLATGDEYLGIKDPHSLILDTGANLGLLGVLALIAALGIVPILALVQDRRSLIGHTVIVTSFAFVAGSFGPSTTWSLTLAWATVGLVQGTWIVTRTAQVQTGSDDPDDSRHQTGSHNRPEIGVDVTDTGDQNGDADEKRQRRPRHQAANREQSPRTDP